MEAGSSLQRFEGSLAFPGTLPGGAAGGKEAHRRVVSLARDLKPLNGRKGMPLGRVPAMANTAGTVEHMRLLHLASMLLCSVTLGLLFSGLCSAEVVPPEPTGPLTLEFGTCQVE